MTIDTCVLIVGGGPAGLATALALRQRGIAVTVADAMKPPIDKACGEGLMPDALRDLAALGVELSVEDGAEFHGIRFVDHGSGVDGRDDELRHATAQFPADGSAPASGIGLRRQTLHTRLAAKAEECGVDLRWEHQVQLRPDGQVLVAGRDVRYEWLIGADGQGSQVRSWAGLGDGKILSRRFGFRRHYRVRPWSRFVEVHWGRSGQAYITPVGPNEVCVATVARDAKMRMEPLLDEMPLLRERLGVAASCESGTIDCGAIDCERGAVTTTRRLRRVARGNVALVGDASGSVDAITGEGMGLAFRQALLLAECIEARNMARYQALHRKTLHLPQTMATVMLILDRREVFRRRALQLLSSRPDLFARMLGVHLGAESLPRFVASRGLELAWRLAVPAAVMEG
jgi:menaquinone-9 beta-reductase